MSKGHSLNLTFPLEELSGEAETRFFVKRIVEALLFASNEPLSFEKIQQVTDTYFPCKPKALRQIIEELQHDYLTQQRAFRLEEVAQGFILRTSEIFRPYIELLLQQKKSEKLSQAATEVLAIIAYRQPITRGQIEAIRGVDSSGTVQALLERELIESQGRSEGAGRPTLYGTTPQFLRHFGLKNLSELTAR